VRFLSAESGGWEPHRRLRDGLFLDVCRQGCGLEHPYWTGLLRGVTLENLENALEEIAAAGGVGVCGVRGGVP
jgi:hypothetical protein